MIIADSHEFIELYRGDKDLRMGIEILKLREDVKFVSFAPDRPSPTDASRFGITRTVDGPIPELPARFRLELMPSAVLRFAKKESGGIMSLMPGYGKALCRLRPDVVFESPFSWLTPRSYQTDRAARAMRVPVVYYDPGDDIPISRKQALLALAEAPVVKRTSRIITYNEAGRDRFVRKYGYPAEKIHVIPKPVDVRRMRPHIDPGAVRQELGVPLDAVVVAYLGRLAAYKGSAALLDVARRALENRDRRAHFLFIGGTLSSSQDSAMYNLPNTTVTGMVANSEVPRVLRAVDVLVFPDVAHPGAFPTAVAEAMAAGKAIIAGVQPGGRHVPLVHQTNALIVDPGCSSQLLAAVEKIVQDDSLRISLGLAVGQYAESEMDYPVQAARYVELAEAVIAEAAVEPLC